jgi:hypothetical protein
MHTSNDVKYYTIYKLWYVNWNFLKNKYQVKKISELHTRCLV